MWSPAPVGTLIKRPFGPLGPESARPADWQLSRGTQLSRLLTDTPRVNLLLVGVDRQLWHLLQAQGFDLREPVAMWSPGERLALPAPTQLGTLILHDVAALSHDDQRQLLEWLEPAARFVQVISTTSVALFHVVEGGSFSDMLYYRLNTMCLDMSSDLDT